jgi:hypothetical protein
MDTIRCPACGSASVRKRTIVYRSGMSYGSRRGRGGDWLRVSVGSIWPRALLSELGWSRIPRSSKARDAAPTAFWPAILALVVLLFVPDGGGWAQMGFVLALIWLSIAAADQLAFERQWVCDVCGSTFTPEPNRDAETEIELDPRSEAPAGEVVTLAPTAKHHLADGKTCSICGEWFPHAEFKLIFPL